MATVTEIAPDVFRISAFADTFGSSALVAISLEVKDGTIFTPETIAKIQRITQRLDGLGYDSQTEAREELRDRFRLDQEIAACVALVEPVNAKDIRTIA